MPVGKFPLERYEKLRASVQQGFGAMFACHRTPECDKRACVGYVVNQVYGPGRGPQNLNLRMALARGNIDPEKMTITGPQFLDYEDMVEANRPKRAR